MKGINSTTIKIQVAKGYKNQSLTVIKFKYQNKK